MNRLTTTAVIVLLLAGSHSPTQAQVTVTLDPVGGAEFAASLGIDLAELEAQLQSEIETKYQAIRPSQFLKAFANAQSFSTNGLGVDYASNPTTTSFGVGLSLAASVDNDLDDAGFAPGASVSIMGGLNLGVVKPELKGLTVYADAFRYSYDQGGLAATITTVGAHAQYKLLRPSNSKKQLIVQWGGLDLSSGLRYSKLAMELDDDALRQDLPVVGDAVSEGVQEIVELVSTGQFDLSSTAFLIPLEVSTNIRVFYVLTVFGGIGTDLQFGSADLDVALTSDLETQINGNDVDLGQATITIVDDGSPSPGNFRAFGGLQLNLWRAKLFMHANARPKPASVGVAFGARVAW